MKKLEDKLSEFCGEHKKEIKNNEVIQAESTKDGLFERVEYVNKKYVTQDGRQLLKETLYED